MESFQSPNDQASPVVLKGRYTIEQKIGEGGFAETYLGRDRQTGRSCVLKILSWKEIPDWKVIELFEREARVLSQMDHPQIPRFIEFFTDETGPETKIVLVQEYIQGKNLGELIREGKRYTEEEVIRLGLEATKILEYLQDFSPPIIHRDIKPSNLLQSENGELHLIDFGAVRDKVLHHQKTEAGGFTVVGTYGFMPFEQFQGQALPASDIYSLGMSLIHLLSHKEPHEMEFVGSDVNFAPYINVSKDFERVLKKMVAHRLEDRYPNAVELRSDLEALLAGEPPQIAEQPKKKKRISSGTFVALLLVLFVGWFAFVKKPMQLPSQQMQQSAPAAPPKPATPAYSGPVVNGTIEFDGRPIIETTQIRPTFWFRNESTGKMVTADVIYSDGKFQIRGLPPGQYGMSIHFDTNQMNPHSYPGDLREWEQFSVLENADASITVPVQKLIHLIQPADNGRVLPHWNRCCEEGKPAHPPNLRLRWDSLGKDVVYDYRISRLNCPYKRVESMASGSTEQTTVDLQLPPSGSNDYYLLELDARKNGQEIGYLMTHGSNGYGWDYRFRVE